MKRRGPELLVLGIGALFLVVLALSFRPGRRPAAGKQREALPAAPVPEASGEATTLLEGFDFTESVGGRPLMRIKADRTVGYGPAAGLAPHLYAGEKVTLTLYPEDGPPVTVHADRADYDERTRESKLRGNVRWTDRGGALAETEQVVFHPATRTLDAARPVHFTQGAAHVNAPSARYDLKERVVRFTGPIEGSGTGEDSGGLSKFTARSGLFRRDQGVLELEYAQIQSRAGDRYAADRVVLKMRESGGHPEWTRGTGNVRGILTDAGGGGPPIERQYAGDESLLAFDAAGRPRSFSVAGAPAVLFDSARRLSAREIEVGFEDGRATNARARGQVRLDSGAARGEARQGSVGFAADGRAENVTLEGEVRVETEGRKALADRAVELEEAGVWLLTGNAESSARVESGPSRLSAERIVLDRARNIVSGEGSARAVFGPDAGMKTGPVTFVGDRKAPTYGKAERIVLDDAGQLATLSGGASLWQGESSLFADDITLSDAAKTVTAVQSVRAVLAPPAGRAQKGEERAASVVTARRLLYRDSDRSARFEGGVAVTRGGWKASGAESTAWLDKSGEVETVEVSGEVRMSDRAFGRSAQADKALDYLKQGKTVLWGAPARVTDAGGNQVAGAVLTIVDRGRSVEVTAPEGGKTETIHRTSKD